jgi:transcriptional regulator with XRE-family HTH domain
MALKCGMASGQLVNGTVLSSISERFRAARERAGYTLDELATLTGLSKAHLSRLESAERQPSIAALLTISTALHIPVGRLLGGDDEDETTTPLAIYGDHREGRHEVAGLQISPCSGYPGAGALEALRMTISPRREPRSPAHHRGEEWLHVLTGTLDLEYDGRDYEILVGCWAHFDAERPHRLRAKGGTTEVLVVAAQGAAGLWASHR